MDCCSFVSRYRFEGRAGPTAGPFGFAQGRLFRFAQGRLFDFGGKIAAFAQDDSFYGRYGKALSELAEAPGVEVLHGLNEFLVGVHDEGTVAGDRLVDGLTGKDD